MSAAELTNVLEERLVHYASDSPNRFGESERNENDQSGSALSVRPERRQRVRKLSVRPGRGQLGNVLSVRNARGLRGKKLHARRLSVSHERKRLEKRRLVRKPSVKHA